MSVLWLAAIAAAATLVACIGDAPAGWRAGSGAVALALLLPIGGFVRQRRRLVASVARAAGMAGALSDSDRRWRALADLSADWAWETDTEHRVVWMSPSAPALTLLGWTDADWRGRRRSEIALLQAPALGWDTLHAQMARREPFRGVECRALSRRGELAIWVALSGRARFGADGGFAGYEGVGRNITERRAAHEALAASEQRWSLMAGLAADWYWETDAEHRLKPPAPEMYKRASTLAERTVGRTRWDAYGDALPAAAWAEHRADLDARRPFRGLQFEIEAAPGRRLWLSIAGIPRFDGHGAFVGYHGVGRDITVRKEAERLLLRHNDALRRAVDERTAELAARTRELELSNRDLDAFSRELAHELRTPIGHVQGLADLLDMKTRDRLGDDERQLIALQRQAATAMRETLDALMLLARSAVEPMAMQALDLSALAADVVATLDAGERRAAVDWRIDRGIAVRAAPAALRIVLVNLLGNAAKFTRRVEAPAVRVSAARDADGRVRIRVDDNGAGFDPAQATRLFEPFGRLHAGDAFHGTGIGLTIVRRIVERHGGTVAARGAPGQGASFEFTLESA